MLESSDERVVGFAANAILDRSGGKPRAADQHEDSAEERARKMTPEQRAARLEEIVRTIKERYGPEIEHEDDKERVEDHQRAAPTAELSGQRQR